MQHNYQPRGKLTATQQQIIEAAIASLAGRGYADTSIGVIAADLKMSKGNVQYHFPSKEVLFQETIAYIYAVANQLVRPSINTSPGEWERIRQFVVGSAAFYSSHTQFILALRELRFNFRPQHHRSYADVKYADELALLKEVFAAGQQNGEFRTFDRDVMALTVRQGLDGLAAAIFRPGYDAARHRDELIEILYRAMRA